MNLEKLKIELSEDPANYGYARLTPQQIIEVLNAADKLGGMVITALTIDQILLWATLNGIFTKLESVKLGDPGYDAARGSLFRLSYNFGSLLDLGNADIQLVLGMLVSNNVLSKDDQNSLLTLAMVPLSRAEVVDRRGSVATQSDVEAV